MDATHLDITLPDAASIDYSDVEEICGYQHLLCKMFERAGGFAYPYKVNATIRQVQSQGHIWLRNVRNIIDGIIDGTHSEGLTLGNVPRMISSYDFLYRICNGKPTAEYTREVRLKTADRWVKGNKSISQTDVVLGILHEANSNFRMIGNKYLTYAYTVVGEWIKELNTYGKFRYISSGEAYSRLTYLLKCNLFAYIGSKDQLKIKAQWIRSYTLTESQLEMLSGADLWSYLGFSEQAALMANQSVEEQEELYMHLLSRLAAHNDLHHFTRQAIEIGLAKHTAA